MYDSLRRRTLLLGTCILAAAAAHGQSKDVSRQSTGSINIAVVYNPVAANPVFGDVSWMQGGSLQIEGSFWHGLGAVADIAGLHTGQLPSSNTGLDLVTATFGPRYTWQPAHHRYAFFGEALIGEANGFNGIFPHPGGTLSSTSSMALQIGGGANVRLNRRVSIRAVEANWLRTGFPNATTNVQNNLRLGTGLVFTF